MRIRFRDNGRVRGRAAFTLVELLVVIAIIGILIALLLPAVQAAREAARRAQCTNNIKQLALALHTFESSYKQLPPGGFADERPWGEVDNPEGSGWGSSWLALILPFIEQGPLFEQLEFKGSSGWGSYHNAAVCHGVKISAFRCPSSTLKEFGLGYYISDGSSTRSDTQLCTYVGISGAVDGLDPDYSEARVNNGGSATNCCSGGMASAGGVLFPHSDVKFAFITDGTSHTAAISEQGGYLRTLDGNKVDWGAGHTHGWLIGARPGKAPPNYGSGGDARHFNMTTIRYPINQIEGWPNSPGNCGAVGLCANTGNNTPLNSTHPGGVNMAMCDGSVRFVSETTELHVLSRLVTRDDEQMLGEF